MSKRPFVTERPLGRMLAVLIPSMPAIAVVLWVINDLLRNDLAQLMALFHFLWPGFELYISDPDRWAADGYAEVMLLGWAIIIGGVAVLYFTIYSWIFPRYNVRYGQHRVKDGRAYWSSTNMPTQIWDRIWGSPPRNVNDHYVLQSWPLNIIAPRKSLIRITTTLNEPVERSLTDMVVDELVGRQMIGPNHLITSSEVIPYVKPDNRYVGDVFDKRAVELVKSCSDLSFGNPHIRHGVMSEASYYEDDRIFSAIYDDDGPDSTENDELEGEIDG